MTSPEQMHRIREDQMDVGFMRPPTNSPDLEMLFVEKSEHVLAAPAGHRLTKLRRLEWGHFQDEKLVLIHPTLQHGFYDSFMELCARAGATPRVSQYANGVHTKMWLISAGFGVGPTSRSMSTVKRPGLVFKELPEGLPLIHTVLAWKRNNPSPTLKNFLNCFTGLDGKRQPRP
jgi:DNA-binding transcriptional LysR family regulator